MDQGLRRFRLGENIPRKEMTVLPFSDFRQKLIMAVNDGARVINFWANSAADPAVRLYAVLAFEKEGQLAVLSTAVTAQYPSLTADCPQVHIFEREIAEQTDIEPVGHPDMRPVRFLPSQFAGSKRLKFLISEDPPGGHAFYQIKGAEVHEVAVGPVHAGIIEPGHFRFQCHGENVFHLEISLGYQHRGVERALTGGPHKRTLHYMETLAGDTSIGHCLAYCQLIETMTGTKISVRHQILRAVALELERLANHVGDLGAIANDVAFLPTASYCGRMRGDFLNMTAGLCGNRFGRSFLVPGGTLFDVEERILADLRTRLNEAHRDLTNAMELMLENASVLERLEGTGIVAPHWVDVLGLVGPAARACGKERDNRLDFPSGAFRITHIPISTYATGDVFSRTCVRWLEVQRSLEFIQEVLTCLPAAERSLPAVFSLPPDVLAVSLVEGWRGEVAHMALTNSQGLFEQYKIVDPSHHNWSALAVALRGEQISNFPLCNKSFNLSYCGLDL